MALVLLGADTVHLGRGTSRWVHLTHFAFDVADDDRSVLARLLVSSAYAHDYATPFPSNVHPFESRVHGRWNLSAIGVDRFAQTTPDEAITVLDGWADAHGRRDPEGSRPTDPTERLARVRDLLRSGTVLRLENPDEAAMHAYGPATGALGFHEFVVLDRVTGSLHVVVASDG